MLIFVALTLEFVCNWLVQIERSLIQNIMLPMCNKMLLQKASLDWDSSRRSKLYSETVLASCIFVQGKGNGFFCVTPESSDTEKTHFCDTHICILQNQNR